MEFIRITFGIFLIIIGIGMLAGAVELKKNLVTDPLNTSTEEFMAGGVLTILGYYILTR